MTGTWKRIIPAAPETPETCRCGRFPKCHPKGDLCGIGFNEFLGAVQGALIDSGRDPETIPEWPDPSISDQGDVDEALDCCVQWCAARLDEIADLERRLRAAEKERDEMVGRVLATCVARDEANDRADAAERDAAGLRKLLAEISKNPDTRVVRNK